VELVKVAEAHLAGEDGELVMRPVRDADGFALADPTTGAPLLEPEPDPDGPIVLQSTESFDELDGTKLAAARKALDGFEIEKVSHVAGGPLVVRVHRVEVEA
jgi:hypothetical protein